MYIVSVRLCFLIASPSIKKCFYGVCPTNRDNLSSGRAHWKGCLGA